MPNVVFVVPFAMASSLRFVRAAARLPGVRVGLLSQDPIERIEPDVRALLSCFAEVDDALDPDRLEAAVRGFALQLGPVDALLGILEPLQESLAVVRERLRIRGMAVTAAHNFRDKARMKQVLAAHGLPCARHRLCADLAAALGFAHEVGYPLVAKPPAGAGAKTTVRVADERALRDFVAGAAPGADRPVLLEEFIRGREFSFDTVSLRGMHGFSSISAYDPTPLEVLEQPWVQWRVVLPRDIDGAEFAEIRELGPRVLDALGMVTGITHMEWFRRPDGSVAIGEVAARPPGAQFMTLMSYAYDTDMYRAWAQLAVHEVFAVPERRFAAGAAYLRGQGRGGQIQRVHGAQQLQQRLGGLVVELRLPQVGARRADSYEGDGYVIVRHPRTEVVQDALRTAVETLRIEVD